MQSEREHLLPGFRTADVGEEEAEEVVAEVQPGLMLGLPDTKCSSMFGEEGVGGLGEGGGGERGGELGMVVIVIMKLDPHRTDHGVFFRRGSTVTVLAVL